MAGVSPRDTAKAVRLKAPTVSAYSKLFFDVRKRFEPLLLSWAIIQRGPRLDQESLGVRIVKQVASRRGRKPLENAPRTHLHCLAKRNRTNTAR